MEARNLDLDVPVTEAQWDAIVQTAGVLGTARGFLPDEGDPPDVVLIASSEQAPAGWQEWLSDPEAYGDPEREAARIRFNDGRPYGSIEPWATPQEPNITTPQVAAMEREMERWVRNRWHELLEESGLHYERGHVPGS